MQTLAFNSYNITKRRCATPPNARSTVIIPKPMTFTAESKLFSPFIPLQRTTQRKGAPNLSPSQVLTRNGSNETNDQNFQASLGTCSHVESQFCTQQSEKRIHSLSHSISRASVAGTEKSHACKSGTVRTRVAPEDNTQAGNECSKAILESDDLIRHMRATVEKFIDSCQFRRGHAEFISGLNFSFEPSGFPVLILDAGYSNKAVAEGKCIEPIAKMGRTSRFEQRGISISCSCYTIEHLE